MAEIQELFKNVREPNTAEQGSAESLGNKAIIPAAPSNELIEFSHTRMKIFKPPISDSDRPNRPNLLRKRMVGGDPSQRKNLLKIRSVPKDPDESVSFGYPRNISRRSTE